MAARAFRPALALEVLVGASGPPIFLKTLIAEDAAGRLRIEGKVRVASGPWGMEEAWWSEDAAERDYWDVELASGGLYRVYRDRHTGDWFADGIYD
jgi:hypothetical protein